MAYDTKEAVLSLGTIDPELNDALQNISATYGNPSLTLDQKRQVLAQQEKSHYETGPTLGTVESVVHIPMRDGHQSETRVFKPGTPPPPSPSTLSGGGSPLIALLFGGGFTGGSNLQLVSIARALAAVYGATVATLSYRLAPDHKFPTAPHDTWDSVRWLSAHAEQELGADLGAGFVLGGVSAGANLAIVTAHKALKENNKLATPLTGLWPCIPVAITKETIPAEHRDLWLSLEQNANAPLLGAKHVEMVREIYDFDPTSEDFTPFSPHATASFARIPRTYVQVAGMDPLRDDGLVYERALRGHGVETKLDVYPGMPHGHFAAFPGLKASGRFRGDVVVGFGWLLGRERDEGALEKLEGLL